MIILYSVSKNYIENHRKGSKFYWNFLINGGKIDKMENFIFLCIQ